MRAASLAFILGFAVAAAALAGVPEGLAAVRGGDGLPAASPEVVGVRVPSGAPDEADSPSPPSPTTRWSACSSSRG